jgi:hypothetical protein
MLSWASLLTGQDDDELLKISKQRRSRITDTALVLETSLGTQLARESFWVLSARLLYTESSLHVDRDTNQSGAFVEFRLGCKTSADRTTKAVLLN